ncbi:DUF4280 domain-containing protein [Candidatus Sneabacter namystus]|nr:DUF4280 domain-containing protein [Candidatus Sneabacter namystus]
MAFGLSAGGLMMCVLGAAPMPNKTLPKSKVLGPSGFFGNIMDKLPMVNIGSFVMCTLPPFPKPCTAPIASPWIPPKVKILISNMPAEDNSGKAMCSLGGMVSISVPTQFKVLFS